jgi:hypothetical protein
MPNGGSDCCGTCPFNTKTKDGMSHAQDPELDFCRIRQLTILDPFWTYCANHLHHNKALVELPVGPVFQADDAPGGYGRKIWVESPDTEEIRLFLLNQLQQIQELPRAGEYPSPYSWDDIVVWQLGAFKESSALDDLKRISVFDPETINPADPFKRKRALTVELAKEAIAKIERGDKA